MYTKKLIDAYKEHMKYVQYKQVAADLDISQQMLTDVRKGRTYLKDIQILMMAEAVGEDKEKALIGLAADKAKTFESQALWSNIAKKFDGLGLRNISLAVSGLAVMLTSEIGVKAQCALWVIMFNVTNIIIFYILINSFLVRV